MPDELIPHQGHTASPFGEIPSSTEFVTPDEIETAVQAKKLAWIAKQPPVVRRIAEEAERLDLDPKDLFAFVRRQLLDDLMTVGAVKSQVLWTISYVMDYARRKGEPGLMLRAAAMLRSIEHDAMMALKSLKNEDFKIFAQSLTVNQQYNNGDGKDDAALRARAEKLLGRFAEVVGTNGTLLVDRGESSDPQQEEEAGPPPL